MPVKKLPLLLMVVAIHALALSFSEVHGQSDDEKKTPNPKVEGRPVVAVAGRIVLFPEGVEEPPRDYKGSIGVRPLALIKVQDKVIGEVFVAPLKKAAADEANGMAASTKNSGEIKLLKRETIKVGKEEVEVAALRLNLKSTLGTPWILHSLYFPHGSSSTSFKLAASEKEFDTALPYFETMLLLHLDRSQRK